MISYHYHWICSVHVMIEKMLLKKNLYIDLMINVYIHLGWILSGVLLPIIWTLSTVWKWKLLSLLPLFIWLLVSSWRLAMLSISKDGSISSLSLFLKLFSWWHCLDIWTSLLFTNGSLHGNCMNHLLLPLSQQWLTCLWKSEKQINVAEVNLCGENTKTQLKILFNSCFLLWEWSVFPWCFSLSLSLRSLLDLRKMVITSLFLLMKVEKKNMRACLKIMKLWFLKSRFFLTKA